MPRLNAENYYEVTLTSAIAADTADGTFTVSQPPDGERGWVVLNFDDVAKREVLQYHSLSGSTLSYYGINRASPKEHLVNAKVVIADVAELYNYFEDLIGDVFFLQRKAALEVHIYGGSVRVYTDLFTVADTDIVLTDNATNYIYFDTSDQVIKVTTTQATAEALFPIYTVVTLGGIITTSTPYVVRSIARALASEDVGLAKVNFAAVVAPGVTNDDSEDYAVGSRWIDTVADLEYVCVDASTGAAIWLLAGGSTPNGDETTLGSFEGATVAEQGTATATGGTGGSLVPMNKNIVKTSSGASDENKLVVPDASGEFAAGFIAKAPLKTVLTAKGSIYGASAASTPAELAIGADDEVLVADASEATGMKWTTGSQFNTGTFTVAGGVTGNKAITGVGFLPKMVEFFFVLSGGSGSGSWGTVMNGAATSSSNRWAGSMETGTDDRVNGHVLDTTNCIRARFSGTGGAVNRVVADFVSMDSDGFTINVTVSDFSFAGDAIAYKCYR